jgi:hypothetical protein
LDLGLLNVFIFFVGWRGCAALCLDSPTGIIDDPSKFGMTGDDEDVRFYEWFDYSLPGVEVVPWNDEDKDEELRFASAKSAPDAPFTAIQFLGLVLTSIPLPHATTCHLRKISQP